MEVEFVNLKSLSDGVQVLNCKHLFVNTKLFKGIMFYSLTTNTMVENTALVDCQEGIAAFVEKRTPKWTNQYNQVIDNSKK